MTTKMGSFLVVVSVATFISCRTPDQVDGASLEAASHAELKIDGISKADLQDMKDKAERAFRNHFMYDDIYKPCGIPKHGGIRNWTGKKVAPGVLSVDLEVELSAELNKPVDYCKSFEWGRCHFSFVKEIGKSAFETKDDKVECD